MPHYAATWKGFRFRIAAKTIRMIGNVQLLEFMPESANFEHELT